MWCVHLLGLLSSQTTTKHTGNDLKAYESWFHEIFFNNYNLQPRNSCTYSSISMSNGLPCCRAYQNSVYIHSSLSPTFPVWLSRPPVLPVNSHDHICRIIEKYLNNWWEFIQSFSMISFVNVKCGHYIWLITPAFVVRLHNCVTSLPAFYVKSISHTHVIM